jgi:hypothetical protein
LPSPTERAILETITNIISSGVDMEASSFFVVVVFERHLLVKDDDEKILGLPLDENLHEEGSCPSTQLASFLFLYA